MRIKRIVPVLAAITTVVVLLIVTSSALDPSSNTSPSLQSETADRPKVEETPYRDVTLGAAQQAMPFRIKLPTYLPKGFHLQPSHIWIFTANENGVPPTRTVYLVYLPEGVNSERALTFEEADAYGGIVVTQDLSPTDEATIGRWIEEAVGTSEGYIRKVSIDGNPGIATAGEAPLGGRWIGDTYYELVGRTVIWYSADVRYHVDSGLSVPVEELIMVAESMT